MHAMSLPRRKRLLIRIDDAGLNIDTNRGVETAALAGVARSVGIMACTPAFDDAARRLRDLPSSIAIGVHLTLNSEWTNVRWGPVLPASRVPSLVDKDGFFPFDHALYRARPPVVAEVLAELRAQIARVRAAGLSPCYADEHMMFAGVHPQLTQPVRDLLAAEGLHYARDAELLRLECPTTSTEGWTSALAEAAPGDYLVITHPAIDGMETHTLTLPKQSPGAVANQRVLEHAMLRDPALESLLKNTGATLINYADLLV